MTAVRRPYSGLQDDTLTFITEIRTLTIEQHQLSN